LREANCGALSAAVVATSAMAVRLAPPTSSDAVKVFLMICAPSRNAYRNEDPARSKHADRAGRLKHHQFDT
jgi:regulation of enolase protein 1 (concanavalin A-like superfamily)